MNLPLALLFGGGAYFLARKLGVLGGDGPATTGAVGEVAATEGSPLEGAKPDQGGRAPSTVSISKVTTKSPPSSVFAVKPISSKVATTVKKPTGGIVDTKKPLSDSFVAKKAAAPKTQATELQSRATAAVKGLAPGLVF